MTRYTERLGLASSPIRRIAAVFLLGFLMSAKGDGSFPFSSAISQQALQSIWSIGAVLFGIGLFFLITSGRPSEQKDLYPKSQDAPTRIVIAIFILGSAVVLALSARYYRMFGYQRSETWLLVCVVVAACALLFLGRKSTPSGHARRMVLAGLGSYLAFAVFSITQFPLHPERSDMLPLINAATDRFLHGANPYGTYAALKSIPLTYLPGLWMCYIPGGLLGIDPRWTNVLAILIGAYSLIRLRREIPASASWLPLIIFIVIPYVSYRHEVYVAVLWLSIVLMYLALRRGKWHETGVAIGWGAAASQFVWIMIPFMLLHYYHRHGWKKCARAFALACAVFVLFLVPFLVSNVDAFIGSTLTYWSQKQNMNGFNISSWLSPLLGSGGLRAAQAGIVIAILLFGRTRLRALSTSISLMAVAVYGFLILNNVTWMYFFPTIVLLAILSTLEEQLPVVRHDSIAVDGLHGMTGRSSHNV